MPQFLTKQSSFHTAQFFVQWGNDEFSKNLRYSINGVSSPNLGLSEFYNLHVRNAARCRSTAVLQCTRVHVRSYRCSEAAIPPYFMQIIDLETEYVYKKNILSKVGRSWY
jgi:hypothetical protein